MPKTSTTPNTKARRSIMAACLLALTAGALIPALTLAWQGGSVTLAIVLTVVATAAAVVAVMASRAAYRWLQLAKTEKPSMDAAQDMKR